MAFAICFHGLFFLLLNLSFVLWQVCMCIHSITSPLISSPFYSCEVPLFLSLSLLLFSSLLFFQCLTKLNSGYLREHGWGCIYRSKDITGKWIRHWRRQHPATSNHWQPMAPQAQGGLGPHKHGPFFTIGPRRPKTTLPGPPWHWRFGSKFY